MGRKRAAGNERLGEYVQRRSGGVLELRFPVPEDVRHAYLDNQGRPRKVIIKSLGTSDPRIANPKADELRSHYRREFAEVREAKKASGLGDFLRWLYNYDLEAFQHEQDFTAEERRRDRVLNRERVSGGEVSRRFYAAALLSENPEERLAAAGWAADEFFLRRGEAFDRQSPLYREVLDQCTSVLVDAVVAKDDLVKGKPVSRPVTPSLREPRTADAGHPNALTQEGLLPISAYFDSVYAPLEARIGAPPKGERNITGKRHSVRLLKEMMGDEPICTISKGRLYEWLDNLLLFPDSRLLAGELRKLSASQVLDRIKGGELSLAPMHAKTANKHLSNISAIVQFAERRRHIDKADAQGVKATVEGGHDDAGRSFTTEELNRIFALPLFAGCAGENVEGGLFKPGPVMIRDDRFWIPLLLLFTGARSAEVVGLLTEEAVVDHDVPHILIQENRIRPRLKNKHSRRMVPIHPRLVDMGFLDFIRMRRDQGSDRLFPMAEQTTYREGATGHAVTRSLSASLIMRQFNRTVLQHADARADGGSAKCFRHTFEQESAAKIGSDEIRQRLTGRKVISTARIYTENIPRDAMKRSAQLARLASDIKGVTYDGVELSHLIL